MLCIPAGRLDAPFFFLRSSLSSPSSPAGAGRCTRFAQGSRQRASPPRASLVALPPVERWRRRARVIPPRRPRPRRHGELFSVTWCFFFCMASGRPAGVLASSWRFREWAVWRFIKSRAGTPENAHTRTLTPRTQPQLNISLFLRCCAGWWQFCSLRCLCTGMPGCQETAY